MFGEVDPAVADDGGQRGDGVDAPGPSQPSGDQRGAGRSQLEQGSELRARERHPALEGIDDGPVRLQGGGAHRQCGQVAGRDAPAQQRTGDGSGRGADDDVGRARVPTAIVLQGGEHGVVVGETGYPPAPEHQAHPWPGDAG